MQSPPTETPPNGDSGKSRLDRELDEILSKNENIRLLPPPPKPPKSKPTPIRSATSTNLAIPPVVQRVLAIPIVLALVLAIVAMLVADFSPFIANVLCFAAVLSIILPIVQRFRGPATPPETRMWRGEVIDVKPQSQSGSILDSVRNWWNSFRR